MSELEVYEIQDDVLKTCVACPEHAKEDSRCAAEFVCDTCGRILNKCAHLPGGLDATRMECSACQLRKELLEQRHMRKRRKA